MSEKRKALQEEAYEQIKQGIITLQYSPGTYLSAASLAEALEIGLSPVHQAVRKLAHEGMLEIIPRKGIIVKPISREEVADIAEMRALTEVPRIRSVIEKADDKDVARLEKIAKKSAQASRRGNTEAIMAADRDFHAVISEIAGNRILADFMANLHDRSLRVIYLIMRDSPHQSEVAVQHAKIVEALRNRDLDAAEQAMQMHITSFRETIERLVR